MSRRALNRQTVCGRSLLLAFPVIHSGSGPREHDVFVLGVLGENLSGVEVLDDFAADHRGEHENPNRRVCSIDDLMRTVLASPKAGDVTSLQHVLASGVRSVGSPRSTITHSSFT